MTWKIVMATSIDLPAEVDRRVESLVIRTGRSKEFLVEQLISRGLAEVEDYYVASKVLERVRQGEEAAFSSTEVRQHLGLVDLP